MFVLFSEPFILRTLLAGVGIALIAGPLGCFVIWHKMAYFGEATAHSALLGITLGLVLGLPLPLGILIVFFLFGGGFLYLQNRSHFSADTVLGILSHVTLAAGLVAYSFIQNRQGGLDSYLFGDILTVSWSHLIWVYIITLVVGVMLWQNWQNLLSVTIHQEMAQAEGVNVKKTQLYLIFCLVGVIASGIQMLGLILIASFLIIPAAAALLFSRSPEQMALLSVGIGIGGTLIGVSTSLQWDTPTGPTIVLVLAVLLVVIWVSSKMRNALLRK